MMNTVKPKQICAKRSSTHKVGMVMNQQHKKRFADSPPIFTVYTQLRREGILVRCPKCGKAALLKHVEEGCRISTYMPTVMAISTACPVECPVRHIVCQHG